MSGCIILSLGKPACQKWCESRLHREAVWWGAGSVIFLQHKEIPVLSTGFLIGYLSYRGRMQRVNRCLDGSGNCEMTPTASYFSDDGTEEEEVPGPRILYWPELRDMLSAKLSTAHLEVNLR